MSGRRSRGSSLLEVVVAVSFALVVLAGAGAVTKSSGDLAASSGALDGASRRAKRVLDVVLDDMRRASRSSIRQADGTAFADGTTVAGVEFRRVTGFHGGLQLDAPVVLRWDRAPGAASGELVRAVGTVEETIARGVTDFAVSRAGDAYGVRVAVRMGSTAATGRTSTMGITVIPRNP